MQPEASLPNAYEIACYTDAQIEETTAQFGPYMLLGPRDERELSGRYYSPAHLGLIIRMDLYRPTKHPDVYVEDWEQLDEAVFHGGDAGQELASLVSLALGIRLRASGISRVFDVGGDPRGYPFTLDQPVPYLPPIWWQAIMPQMVRASANLSAAVPLMRHYPSLSARQAAALVRAARSYQEAVWIAESDPRQAWLRLVVAIEAASQEWPAGDQIDGATRRFVQLIMTFLPKAPERRPHRRRLDWQMIPDQLATIYNLRSRDVHDGRPFPPSLCRPPYAARRIPDELVGVELGPDVSGESDLMQLHMFEYIVRGALHRWWTSTSSTNQG